MSYCTENYLHIDVLRYVADPWRMDYNHDRPHSSLDYMTPAAFVAMRDILSYQLVQKAGADHKSLLLL
jgi:transposase InsO family protein